MISNNITLLGLRQVIQGNFEGNLELIKKFIKVNKISDETLLTPEFQKMSLDYLARRHIGFKYGQQENQKVEEIIDVIKTLKIQDSTFNDNSFQNKVLSFFTELIDNMDHIMYVKDFHHIVDTVITHCKVPRSIFQNEFFHDAISRGLAVSSYFKRDDLLKCSRFFQRPLSDADKKHIDDMCWSLRGNGLADFLRIIHKEIVNLSELTPSENMQKALNWSALCSFVEKNLKDYLFLSQFFEIDIEREFREDYIDATTDHRKHSQTDLIDSLVEGIRANKGILFSLDFIREVTRYPEYEKYIGSLVAKGETEKAGYAYDMMNI